MELDKAIEYSTQYLESDEALSSLNRDPYWPKWNSPWWHMLLLFELGQAEFIPVAIVEHVAEKIDNHFIHFFPIRENEIPEDCDPYRNIICHCALGSILQIFHACGLDYRKSFSWVENWFETYQLPDGGYNCDEQVYTQSQKSSIVSTLPILEFLLLDKDFSVQVREKILHRGYVYLMNRKLVYSLTRNGQLMHQDFIAPTFPRFYHYDILRGLKFLVAYASAYPEFYSDEIFEPLFAEAELAIQNTQVNPLLKTTTLDIKDDKWKWGPASSFSLLNYFKNSVNIEFRVKEEFMKLEKHWEKFFS